MNKTARAVLFVSATIILGLALMASLTKAGSAPPPPPPSTIAVASPVTHDSFTCSAAHIEGSFYDPVHVQLWISGALKFDQTVPVSLPDWYAKWDFTVSGLNGYTYREVIGSERDTGTVTVAPCIPATTTQPATTVPTSSTSTTVAASTTAPSVPGTMQCQAIISPDTRVCPAASTEPASTTTSTPVPVPPVATTKPTTVRLPPTR